MHSMQGKANRLKKMNREMYFALLSGGHVGEMFGKSRMNLAEFYDGPVLLHSR
ncbi:MAG: hypothetical protein Q8862_00040 [Bacteroidota bacterium]|nr:hypothetical protein [Bacteroidota bacterium]